MDLREYEHAKFELAGVLQSAATLVATNDESPRQDQFRDLFVRLAEDRFNLVFAGRFNRGKSSLMNALLGADRLPTGIVPLTSVITTVSYGTSEKVTLQYQRGRLDSEIALDELPKYITQRGNPGNNRGIATANVELPVEILRRGFYFVDTPGLGSVIPENAATTQAYIPEMDALLLVTSFESPLSEEELRFFRSAFHYSIPIFVAINKQDLVAQVDRDEAVTFVRDYLQELFGEMPPEVFAVSARDGLAAKLATDGPRLQASGIPALEAGLTTFLLEHKQTEFLARICSRVQDLLGDLPQIDGMAALRAQARTLVGKFGKPDRQITGPDFGHLASPFDRSQLQSCEICAEIEGMTWDFLARYQYECHSACNIDPLSRGIGVQN